MTRNVAQLVISATKEQIEKAGGIWSGLLGYDALDRDSKQWKALEAVVQRSVEPVWAERLSSPRPLLLTNAGPLVRYGMTSLLATLLDTGTKRPAARWLLVAKAGVPYVVMHWRGHSHDMNNRAVYSDVLTEVRDELRQRIDGLVAEGGDPALMVLDDFPENFLVMNGDILTDIDYGDLLETHIESKAPLTIATNERETRIELKTQITGSEQKVDEVKGTRDRRIKGDNSSAYRSRVAKLE